jgi:hypothetical protein
MEAEAQKSQTVGRARSSKSKGKTSVTANGRSCFHGSEVADGSEGLVEPVYSAIIAIDVLACNPFCCVSTNKMVCELDKRCEQDGRAAL